MKQTINYHIEIIAPQAPAKSSRLPRRPGVNKVKMTQEIADTIRTLHRTTPMKQSEIGSLFGVNQGNVSKILKGKWYPEKPGTVH